MENGEIIVCGLTEFENKIIREHKGECRYCQHYYDVLDGRTVPCGKGHMLSENKGNGCKDWFIDTR